MLRRSILVLPPCLVLLAGCGLVPSDPVVAPIGFRLDGDVISVLIPRCAGQAVTSATIEQVSGSETWTPTWEAADFTGDPSGAIRLDDADWTTSTGTYSTAESAMFSISVTTTDAEYGAGRITADELAGIPPGQFMVDYTTMSAREYLAEASAYPCPRVSVATDSPSR